MKDAMRQVILQQPNQITRSLDVNRNTRVEGEFDWIILVGMGGSGHPGDLLNALHLTKVPLTVHRSYNLPHIISQKPLVIASSYSGNTEEPLSAYREAQAENYGLLANASGGTLAQWCERDGTPITKIDFVGMQPRHTLLASFASLATTLKNSGLAEDISQDLQRVATTLAQTIPQLELPGKELAKKLKGKIPVFTASRTLAFAAQNFKIQVNENAKMPAFWNFFPELNHNELVGFSRLQDSSHQSNFHVLIIRDDDDHPRIKARMDVTAELYKKWGIELSAFDVKGDTLLEKILYALSFGLWTTYYLALEYNINPVPVEGVESFKKLLKEKAGEI